MVHFDRWEPSWQALHAEREKKRPDRGGLQSLVVVCDARSYVHMNNPLSLFGVLISWLCELLYTPDPILWSLWQEPLLFVLNLIKLWKRSMIHFNSATDPTLCSCNTARQALFFASIMSDPVVGLQAAAQRLSP